MAARATPQRLSPVQEVLASPLRAGRRRHAHIAALAAIGSLVLVYAATWLWQSGAAVPSLTLGQLQLKSLGCNDGAKGLRGRNWTDGDPSVPAAGVCKWHENGIERSRRGGSSCSALLGVPKVAMLFLTMGEMRHEVLWSLWLGQAAGRLPADCLAAATCGPQRTSRLQRAMRECLRQRQGPLQQQVLFSVYTHPPPGYEPYGQDSLFFGTEIAERINSSWGTFDLAQVARNLMAAALADPLNQRFMTISESCIPLYPPHVVYRELTYAAKSRINACTTREGWGRDEYRWTWRFEEMTLGRLRKEMWRKNHQWLGLTRKHARLVVADREIAEAFAKHCYSGKDPDFGGWWRTCFSDEHYFSTLLAFHGLDEETDCMGEITHTFWCTQCSGHDRLHPKTYKADEISIELLKELRQEGEACNARAAYAAAGATLPDIRMAAVDDSFGPPSLEAPLLQPRCPLFARKFSSDSPAIALHALLSLILREEQREAALGLESAGDDRPGRNGQETEAEGLAVNASSATPQAGGDAASGSVAGPSVAATPGEAQAGLRKGTSQNLKRLRRSKRKPRT